MALTQKTSRKKSSESMVQPRKAARKVRLWAGVSRRKSFRTYIYARIAGPMDQGTEYRTRTSFPRLVYWNQTIIVATNHNRSASNFTGDFARKTVPCFLSIGKKLPSPTPTAAHRPVTERKLR